MRQLPDHSSRIISSDLHHPQPFRVSVAPGDVAFGNVVINRSSIAHAIVVTNVGEWPVQIGEVDVTGSYTATHDAPTYLNPGQYFTINVVFSPKNEGIHKGGVYVDTNGAKGTEYARLLGYGYVAGTDPGGGEPGQGEGEGGVTPKYFPFRGDGETAAFPLNGADVFEKLLFDTALEQVPSSLDYYVVNPTDYTIDPPVLGSPASIRFNVPPADGCNGFTVLRGYAKPYVGPPPIDTVAPGVDTTIIVDNTVINRANQNTILVVNSSDPITILIRKKAGDDTKDWKNGEFFSVMQRGNGPVTIAIEGDSTGAGLFPALYFVPTTRGKNCTISATCINADADQWMISGDMLRGTESQVIQTITMVDRSVLINSTMITGASKDSYRMLTGMKLDPIAENGLVASLMTAQTSGNIFTADILRNGVSILASKLVINNGTTTSQGAVTPATYVAGGDTLLAGDEITLSITQVGNGTARGLRVYLTGQQS